MKILCLAGLAFALAPLAAAQSIHVVDETGAGGAFLEIQDAVDVAAAGDLVLVQTGSYSGFSVLAKGLTVAADSGAAVVVNSIVRVRDLPVGSEVTLSGMTISVPPGFPLPFNALSMTNCAGFVLVQDMTLDGGPEAGRLTNCAAVSFVSCDIASSIDGAPGVFVQDSQAFFHDSSIQGGAGNMGDTFQIGGFEGGPGLWVVADSTVLVVGCDVAGGPGGPGLLGHPLMPFGGDGGPAVKMSGTNPSVTYASTYVGGAGGSSENPLNFGDPGPVYTGVPGLLTTTTNVERQLVTDSVLRVGDMSSIKFVGVPFDFTWHLFAIETGTVVYMPDILGAFYPGGATLLVEYRGRLKASGMKTLSFTLSSLGITYVPVFQQALMYNATEGFVASNPRQVVLLD